MLEEKRLSDGTTVWCRPAPPLMVTLFLNRIEELQAPPIPIVEVPGRAGSEWMPARPLTKEYEEWAAESREISRRRQQLRHDIVWDYGVVKWRLPDCDDIVEFPPAKWVPSAMFAAYNVPERPGPHGRRLDYIQTVLLKTIDDMDGVQAVILGGSPGEDAEPLEPEEVDNAVDMFQRTQE